MGRISISKDRTYFIKDGRPFFYLADTAWMAFEKLSVEEWEEYVCKRRGQGFSVIQISMLPISHDNSIAYEEDKKTSHPFLKMADGKDNFYTYEEAYFQKVEKMLSVLQDAGMTACLHLLWSNYIPDTWAAKLSPDTIMPFAAVAPYVRYVAGRYQRYCPIYSISGDTSFETEQVTEYYKEALGVLKETDRDCLATLHLQPLAQWPECLIEDERLDYYSYQGGHYMEQQDNNSVGAEQFLGLGKRRPIVNSEPPYEGHGWGYRYGRFDAFDIRKAIWQSILSGAKAGVSYGAHGVWMFHTGKCEFNNRAFSDMPYDWRTAMELEGAWDAGYAGWLYETYHMHRLMPAQLCDSHGGEIKTAMSLREDLIVVYVPYQTELFIQKNLADYQAIIFDLEKRHIIYPEISYGEVSVVPVREYCKDVVMVFNKKTQNV